jgi:magnesium-transporting ATPase (P-type)
MIYIFAYRSMRRPLTRMTPLSENKPLILAVLSGLLLAVVPFMVPSLRTVLGIVPLTIVQWGLIACIALSLLLVVEVGKAIANRAHRTA